MNRVNRHTSIKTHTLSEYRDRLQEAGLLVEAHIPDAAEPVEYLSYNSKDLGKNTLFVCKGAAFKEEYFRDVCRQGILAYVSETAYGETDPAIASFLVQDIRKAMPVIADLYYNRAWEELNLIGITGTKGKSTTAYYVKYILDAYLLDHQKNRSGIISSIDTYDGVIQEESHLTTPEAMDLHMHFRNAVNSHIEYMEMEVSSQALKYDRVDGITFDVGVYLNISEDHISPLEHPDFEDYFAAKLKIFQHCRTAVVNMDADRWEDTRKAAQQASSMLTFSTQNPMANIFGYDIQKEGHDTVFKVKTKEFDRQFRLTMPGLFNVENALAAIGAVMALGIPVEYMVEGLERARSSGRMEIYASKDNQIVAIVDYAHNKLSFEKLFSSVQQEYPGRDIISIFGCPGLKALLRREDLGTIAGRYSKKVYIVAEDPGLEPFMDISRDIAQYVEAQHCEYEIIEERGEAIQKAIAQGKNCILLITGKGNETRQKYGANYLPCISDVEYTKKYLEEYNTRQKE
ncbi:Mur ligase family protein [Bianquea renquensis]|uniref:UDP-N-acetylmuramoyl-L-alanyl-D-glutamate--2, 6-diaminopimelate ligase n=1 Tax=Bianquea renquensis TaxID=2763661 RepID=A0A926DU12_9FIRM|nr:UDP-N-acetylmuramoyl-L-alanyl-D-glutamate--2,6-diaminopimelate ligase [Bianquea renquensis]MBC8544061.1 UDP-N-acetylmuramoyl-L-alanyl-D-glutamate--2,6-diaminopimelate ligase [Bianquea renquensis]